MVCERRQTIHVSSPRDNRPHAPVDAGVGPLGGGCEARLTALRRNRGRAHAVTHLGRGEVARRRAALWRRGDDFEHPAGDAGFP